MSAPKLVADSLVLRAELCAPLPTLRRRDVAPLLAAACALPLVMLVDEWGETLFSVGAVLLALVAAALQLAALWHVPSRLALRFRTLDVSRLRDATHIFVAPVLDAGAPEICALARGESVRGHEVHFFFQRSKFVFRGDETRGGEFRPLEYPVSQPLRYYAGCRGLSEAEARAALELYGRNTFDVPIPTFGELFKEHMQAPFFVFQMFCMLLWLLDEYWFYTMLTMAMLLVAEAAVIKRRLSHLQLLRGMNVPTHEVAVFRGGKWVTAQSDALVPGDVIALARGDRDLELPCDVLLLGGSCVANEALLTGESEPQIKVAVALAGDADATQLLSVDEAHKSHVVFGGTKVLLAHAPETPCAVKSPPNRGAVGFVLRTGFATSQGRLVRTILFSSERVTVDSREALLFILFLFVFALIATGYVLVRGLADPTRSRYKLLLDCVIVLTSVVPPELPMELSYAVNLSLNELQQERIFCTEPFRIPLAGAVDVCCFDKTETLTSDDFVFKGVASLAPPDENGAPALTAPGDLPEDVKVVLGGCHSLAVVDDEVLGSSLERAALEAMGWTLSRGEVASARRGGRRSVRVLHRFAFSSKLRRMACVVAVGGVEGAQGAVVRVVCKGAPDEIATRFVDRPQHYERDFKQLMQRYSRVLALGYKELPGLSPDHLLEIRALARDAAESELRFAGFLVMDSPLKPASQPVIAALARSAHRLVMITGDHELTACHVAAQLGITRRPVLLLHESALGGAGEWRTLDESRAIPYGDTQASIKLAREFDLCLRGSALRFMRDVRKLSAATIGRLCCHVSVFARASPAEKEFVLTWMKQHGMITLMCGDGTNDVGALKQAHVGVALITEVQPRGQGKERKAAAAAAAAAAPAAAPAPTAEQRMARLRERVEAARRGVGAMPTQAEIMQEMMAGNDQPLVRLGDASIAAPFTSRVPDISCVLAILRQGRCTLVTTLQVMAILGVNSLIFAYRLSVLHVDGVKLSDAQMTASGLAVALFFLFTSRAKSVHELSRERPQTRIFSVPFFASLLGQFALHFGALLLAVEWARPFTPTDPETRSPDAKFSPNVLNSVVFLLSSSQVVATFFANYRGRPFMISLRENRPLLYMLLASEAVLLLAVLGYVPALSAYLELTLPASLEFQNNLALLLLVDLVGSVAIARAVTRLCPKLSAWEVPPDEPPAGKRA